jgi:hypothetical protein
VSAHIEKENAGLKLLRPAFVHAPMSAYRDEFEALKTKTTQLEEQLEEREARIGNLEQKLAEKGRGWATFGGGVVATLGVVGCAGAMLVLFSARKADAGAVQPQVPAQTELRVPDRLATAAASATPVVPVDPANLCSRLGIRLTVDGSDAEAPAVDKQDASMTKYRKNGDRAVAIHVGGGNLYVHGWGTDMPTNIGSSKMSLFDITTKGESGGYTLARDGRSLLDVQGNDGKNSWGRFEADMSRVDDVTRTPAFGTPVVRVRGNFCLPFRAGDPHDTGP